MHRKWVLMMNDPIAPAARGEANGDASAACRCGRAIRVYADLDKGEARKALARAVFLCGLGKIRDRSFEQRLHRASGLTLVIAAIVICDTLYTNGAISAAKLKGAAASLTCSSRSSHLAK